MGNHAGVIDRCLFCIGNISLIVCFEILWSGTPESSTGTLPMTHTLLGCNFVMSLK